MVFACDYCHYLFNRDVQPKQCPDCGKYAVRPANETEVTEFEREQLGAGEPGEDREHFPDFCQVQIIRPHYFTFMLPVTAFGIRDTMVMEFSAEYMESEDQTQYQVTLWCRQRGSRSKHFLYALSVPVSTDTEERIMAALNEDPDFDFVVRDYIDEAAKHRCD